MFMVWGLLVFFFSYLLPFALFVLAFMCSSYNKKQKLQLILNGLILIFYPHIQNKIYGYIKQQMKK